MFNGGGKSREMEVGELAEDPADETRGLVFDFEKFPPDMDVAAHRGNVVLAFHLGEIGAEAVALDGQGDWLQQLDG